MDIFELVKDLFQISCFDAYKTFLLVTLKTLEIYLISFVEHLTNLPAVVLDAFLECAVSSNTRLRI
jgi:hypothetical protein